MYVFFLACAGLSHQLLRILRLSTVWSASVVMFIVFFPLGLALKSLDVALQQATWTEMSLEIRQLAKWATLFATVFTAFWWISIRPRPTR